MKLLLAPRPVTDFTLEQRADVLHEAVKLFMKQGKYLPNLRPIKERYGPESDIKIEPSAVTYRGAFDDRLKVTGLLEFYPVYHPTFIHRAILIALPNQMLVETATMAPQDDGPPMPVCTVRPYTDTELIQDLSSWPNMLKVALTRLTSVAKSESERRQRVAKSAQTWSDALENMFCRLGHSSDL